MSLYKYVPPERLDILRNLRIRFTQPGAQNDPFEFRPLVDRFRRPEKAAESLSDEWERYFPERFSEQFGPQAFAEIKKRFPTYLALRKSIDIAKADKQSDGAAREEILQELNRRVGILSLSEVSDSLLLWCRYASGHTGFVYEFDDKHPWFSAKTEEKDDTHELRKVSYVDVPSSPYLAELDAHEVLYSKRKEWECERERRIIRPLVERCQCIGKDVYLFGVPPTALTGIIVGSLATEGSIEELVRIINSNPDLAHLRVGCTHHIPSDCTVTIEYWPGSVAQIRTEFGAAS
ncbi:MAG TPA: hypothetical protein VN911_21245 [Candidatus Acidoferrum sp.]|nr:hypothetical protein [Candidatus Acidoferrum sp.]